jgi:hypothetical protein
MLWRSPRAALGASRRILIRRRIARERLGVLSEGCSEKVPMPVLAAPPMNRMLSRAAARCTGKPKVHFVAASKSAVACRYRAYAASTWGFMCCLAARMPLVVRSSTEPERSLSSIRPFSERISCSTLAICRGSICRLGLKRKTELAPDRFKQFWKD